VVIYGPYLYKLQLSVNPAIGGFRIDEREDGIIIRVKDGGLSTDYFCGVAPGKKK